VSFDVQSKRILVYRTIEELKEKLPVTLAQALAVQPRDAFPSADRANISDRRLFLPAEPADGFGLLRRNDYLCISNAGETIYLPPGPYSFLRLMPSYMRPTGSEVETYRIAQAQLRPMMGARSAGWRVGRHETGTVAFVPNQTTPQVAQDASELFLSGELWANNFYFVDPKSERAIQQGFPFIPTGAVEEVFLSTLSNFIMIARDHLNLELPVQIQAGLVGVQNYRLAVNPEYFHFSNFEGRILRASITHETALNQWTVNGFETLRPLFEKMYDAAGLKRPNIRPADS
jgi:hypothetical protein